MAANLKSKSELLFDSLFSRKPLAPIRENVSETPRQRVSRSAKKKANISINRSSSSAKSRKKRPKSQNVHFLDDNNLDESTIPFKEPVHKYTRKVTDKSRPQKSQKDEVLEAFGKSNLPDFDSLPPLTVIEVNKWEVDRHPEKADDPDARDCIAIFDTTLGMSSHSFDVPDSSAERGSTMVLRKRRNCMTPQEIHNSTLHLEASFELSKDPVTFSDPMPSIDLLPPPPPPPPALPAPPAPPTTRPLTSTPDKSAPRFSVDSRLSSNLSFCVRNVPQSTPLPLKNLHRNVVSTSARQPGRSHISGLLRSDFSKLQRTILPASPTSTLRFAQSTFRAAHPSSLQAAIESFAIAFSETSVIHPDGHEDILTSQEKLLALCSPSHITSFDAVFTADILPTVKKINEGSYAEVYLVKYANPNGKPVEVVFKINPFELRADPQEEAYDKLLPELVIFNTFNKLLDGSRNRSPNFIRWISSSCVRGQFLPELVDQWNAYADKKESYNDHPDRYTKDSLHLVIATNNGGVDLESYKLSSAGEAVSIFLQVAFSLAAAEAEYGFEHRDLHWGNILVSECDQDKLEYCVKGETYEINSAGLMVQIIDFTLSRINKDGFIVFVDLEKDDDLFNGLGIDAGSKGDYQFDVYRMMRDENNGDWHKFTPKTNTLWLDYLIDKLLTAKKYRSRRKEHKYALDMLKRFHHLVKAAPSASSLVTSSFFAELLGEISK